ncbi:MAG: hypothetical protein JNL41_03395 [Phenylobacterium sp.]|uniref:helix-turn-helix transcriptional regulator n=1 Tax=Phenylobacterium sp. TaxID=1871053 RepID=UPI001A5D8F5A|nr:helix-turn-helix transcriptional regulator [Phenylobacterium sp.]MBL8553298.1 hypothetical protein [Phenylobacterium sp.]
MSDVQAASQAIDAAPFADDGWQDALRLTAESCGGWVAQLLGITDRLEVRWNWQSGLALEASADFERRMADNPQVNPRASIVSTRAMIIRTDESFIEDADRHRNAFYREFYDPLDVSHVGIVKLATRQADTNSVLAVLRTGARGAMEARDLEVMSALIPRWDAAVRVNAALEGEAATLVASGLEALSTPAFVLNRFGRMVALTAAGETVLMRGSPLRLNRSGGLSATEPSNALRLRKALDAVLSLADAVIRPVILQDADGPIVAEIARLPRGLHDTGQGAAAILILARQTRSASQVMELLREAYGLTTAEAEVAVALLAGRAMEEIASLRRVRVQTLRNQLKSIFARLGVSSQAQLVAKLSRIVGVPSP